MNNSTELPDYRCPSDCDCDTCAINKAKQQVHLFKEIEKQFDYCETFHFYRNMHYLNKNEYEKIFSTKLTPHNAIEYGPIFFFMLKIEKSEDGTDYIDPSDEDTDLQVDTQLISNANSICARVSGIESSYIKKSLQQAEYKFFISSKVDITSNKTCPIMAFILLKKFNHDSLYSGHGPEEPLYSFLKKFKIMDSLLVCAIELTREDLSAVIAKKIVLKASLGSIITYKSVQFAASEKFDYYFGRAASVSLIYVYKNWGFNLGLPFLNLNHVLSKYQEILSVGNDEQKETTLSNIIQNEIKLIFQKNYRVCKTILDINKGQYEDELQNGSNAFEVEALVISDFIYDKKSASFNIFIDLSKGSEDIENLYNYSYRRFGRFLSYNKFYEQLITNDSYDD
jgi:hypothetical protein